MVLFEDGLRHTYYCITSDCDSFWNSCEPGNSNALPEVNSYTYQDGTLTIDLNFGNAFFAVMEFVCDVKLIKYDYDSQSYIRWHKPGYDPSACNE